MESRSLSWHNITIQVLPIDGILPDAQLLPAFEQNKLKTMKSESRKREYFGTRLLAQRFLPEFRIEYSKHGKPFLTPAGKGFSISHSSHQALIAYSDIHANIAIDIERKAPRVLKIVKKFIGKEESEYLRDENELTCATIIWSAKEVMFKLMENGSLDFINHYRIDPFPVGDSSDFRGHYKYESIEHEMQMHYWLENETVIVAGYILR